MRAVKIVLVTQHFPPDFEGGTEVVVRAQARALLRLGHDVSVIAGSDQLLGEGERELRRSRVDGFGVTWVPRTAAESYDLVLARPRVLDHVLREAQDADLVHVHHWSTLDASLVRCLSEIAPVAVTLHDHFTSCPRFFRRPADDYRTRACPRGTDISACISCVAPALPSYGEQALERRLSLRAHGFREELDAAATVIAPSRARAAAASRLTAFPRERIEVVPHGLCRAVLRVEPPAPYRPDRRLVVAHFGNLCAEKGTLDLMQSLALLPRGSVELRLAGRVLDREVEDVARRLEDQLSIRRTLTCPPADLRSLADGADLAAFPSRLDESYGLVVDEALALGLPVWLSEGAPAHERLAEWGTEAFSLPAEQPRAWADAFRAVQREPESLELERAGVPTDLPTAADAALRLEALYTAVLSGDLA